jgi:hypothetical protein
MIECKFYERNEDAFREHLDYIRWRAAENPSQYMDFLDEDRDELPCGAFCKYCTDKPGLPDEILTVCEHPDNEKILNCVTMIDGADEY